MINKNGIEMTETTEEKEKSTKTIRKIKVLPQKGEEQKTNGELPRSIINVCNSNHLSKNEKSYYCNMCKGGLTLYCQDCMMNHMKKRGHPDYEEGHKAMDAIINDVANDKSKVVNMQDVLKKIVVNSKQASGKIDDITKESSDHVQRIQKTITQQQENTSCLLYTSPSPRDS